MFKIKKFQRVSEEKLLEFLRLIYKKEKKIPRQEDFNNNPGYPGFDRYVHHFGSWNKALKKAGIDPRKRGGSQLYSDKELLKYLTRFFSKNEVVPTECDFKNNNKYPSHGIYVNRFGSWTNALRLVKLDVDSMVRKGTVKTTHQKGRLFELHVLTHFNEKIKDLSGENCNSPIDGVCPTGQLYDAKSVGLIRKQFWAFNLESFYRSIIEWFYLGAFDKNYNTLLHVWRIPGNFVDVDNIKIWIGKNRKYNEENMKDFEITYKFKGIKIFK